MEEPRQQAPVMSLPPVALSPSAPTPSSNGSDSSTISDMMRRQKKQLTTPTRPPPSSRRHILSIRTLEIERRHELQQQWQGQADAEFGTGVVEVLTRHMQDLELSDDSDSEASDEETSDSSSGDDANDNQVAAGGYAFSSPSGKLSVPNDQPLLLTPKPSDAMSLQSPPLSGVPVVVDARVSKIQNFARETTSDCEEHYLYIAREPIMLTKTRRGKLCATISGSLADGDCQIRAEWNAFDEHSPVPNLPAGTLLKMHLLILRRLDDEHRFTIDMRIIVMQWFQVGERRVEVDGSSLLALPWWEHVASDMTALVVAPPPTSSSSSAPPPTPSFPFWCDGSNCSAAMNRASGHDNPGGDDYGAYQGDVDAGAAPQEPFQPLVLSQCVLETFQFSSLEEMRRMNRYVTLEVDEMEQHHKRHLHYYYISIVCFRARQRLELPSCVVAYIRATFPYSN